MKKKAERILTQQSTFSLNNQLNQQSFQQTELPKTIIKTKQYQPKASSNRDQRKSSSNREIKQKSLHIVNDNFVSKLNPKRSSIDLTSFIQVFRKKIRQTTIAKEFQNSLEKFMSLSDNRSKSYSRLKGGFVGSYKKQNELLVQNNRIDNKIKKIIISDLEFNERKIRPKVHFGQNYPLEKQTSNQNYDFVPRNKSSRFSKKKILKYAQTEENDEAQSFTFSFSNGMYSPDRMKDNPEHFTENMKTNNNFTPTLYHQKEKEKESPQSSKQNKSSLFQNRRLETITLYQRPNLMYNLSLYRKKQPYNILKGTKKRAFHTQNDEQ